MTETSADVGEDSPYMLDPNVIDPRIPAELHPAMEVARKQWQEMNPGMELDATADVIVLALAKAGLLCTHRRRAGATARRADANGG